MGSDGWHATGGRWRVTGGSERSTIISSNCFLQRDVSNFLKRSENFPTLAEISEMFQ